MIPLPDRDFDPTEVAVPWSLLTEAGHEVVFATENGERPLADPIMVSGEGLDPWGFVPGLRRLKLIGLILRARRGARDEYEAMQRDPGFMSPMRHADLKVSDFDGLIIPGGHGPGMVQLLDSEVLKGFVAQFFDGADGAGGKPVGAICHGVVLAARSISPSTGKSVLNGRKTTALTWRQERAAWRLTRYFARFWDPDYYRTYSEADGDPAGHMSVESEVRRALESDADFVDVTKGVDNFRLKIDNTRRDTRASDKPAWVVRDGNYVSARWPGDAYTFTREFLELLESGHGSPGSPSDRSPT